VSKQVRVHIEWRTHKSGGRESPFLGTRYSTVVRFDGWPRPWEEGQHWSVVIDFDPPRGTIIHASEGSMRFLSDGSPDDVLVPGKEFELYEGRRCTAVGAVLSIIGQSG
jgi:hypothetical protein